MSHFTEIKTQIKDIEALRLACQELGLGLVPNTEARGYYENKTKGDYVIKLKGPYDIALNKQHDGTFDLTADLWQGHAKSGSALIWFWRFLYSRAVGTTLKLWAYYCSGLAKTQISSASSVILAAARDFKWRISTSWNAFQIGSAWTGGCCKSLTVKPTPSAPGPQLPKFITLICDNTSKPQSLNTSIRRIAKYFVSGSTPSTSTVTCFCSLDRLWATGLKSRIKVVFCIGFIVLHCTCSCSAAKFDFAITSCNSFVEARSSACLLSTFNCATTWADSWDVIAAPKSSITSPAIRTIVETLERCSLASRQLAILVKSAKYSPIQAYITTAVPNFSTKSQNDSNGRKIHTNSVANEVAEIHAITERIRSRCDVFIARQRARQLRLLITLIAVIAFALMKLIAAKRRDSKNDPKL